MRSIVLALIVLAGFAASAFAQCPGGVCPAPSAPRMVRPLAGRSVSVGAARGGVSVRYGRAGIFRRLLLRRR